MSDRAFSGLGNNTTVAAGVASVSQALPGTPTGGQFVRIYNGTAAAAFWHAFAIFCALPRNSSMSSPIAAAGAMPKFDSAE